MRQGPDEKVGSKSINNNHIEESCALQIEAVRTRTTFAPDSNGKTRLGTPC